ncbi:MAG: ribosomal-processing cysteine protease Prp [Bacillota bacterium]|nr:ribosomal-processing cysteine protease Prp [Bacillota bacterium]
MVLVEILQKQDRMQSIRISGHAQYADAGQDLVCAGVSSIGIGALNALDEIFSSDVRVEQRKNKILIKVLKDSDTLQTTLRFLLYQLETMVEVYPQYIQIKKDEV